jgi:predicted TPR repeat methyltransferase
MNSTSSDSQSPEQDGVTPREAIALAASLLQKGHPPPAAEICRRVLAVAPADADAHHFLGLALYQLGGVREGLEHIRQAVDIDPDYADAHNNLGNVLRQQGFLDDAALAYERALSLRPNGAEMLNNVGTILRARGRIDEAIVMYKRALEQAPDHAEAHHNLGNAFLALDRDDEAIDAYRRALLLLPYHGASYNNLGTALHCVGRVTEAAELYQRWVELDPDNPEAHHMLAACTGANVPLRASDGYVRRMFDRFAYSFDEVLGRLEYKAPALVATAVADVLGSPSATRDVLDAGSGTGLVAPLVRPYARRLVGVDLSEKMLAFSRARNIYDELVLSELTEYLTSQEEAFDLITSVDTLCYFGDLDAVLQAASRACRIGGLLVFTVESLAPDEANIGFRLNPHGRYSHTEGYVCRILDAADFELVSLTPSVLRHEMKRPVSGFVVSARRRPA